jgi:hypothetical protein
VDIPDGGSLLLQGNRLQKGPGSSNPETAVALGEESARNRTEEVLISQNYFDNDTGRTGVFVRNRTETPAALDRNVLSGDVVPLVGPGRVR